MTENNLDLHFDIAIVIALTEEFNYFKQVLNDLNLELLPIQKKGNYYYRFNLSNSMDEDIHCIAGFIGSKGEQDALLWVEHIIEIFHPSIVVNIGISGRLGDDVKLGDVVIATEAQSYLRDAKIHQLDPNTQFTLSDLRFGGKSFPTTRSIVDLIRNFKYQQDKLWNEWTNDSRNDFEICIPSDKRSLLKAKGWVRNKAAIHIGPVASGPLVIDSVDLKEKIKQINRNLIAIDMEAAGIVDATFQHEYKPHSLVLRGISDFADGKKTELDDVGASGIRRWAMGNAVRLFVHIASLADISDKFLNKTITKEQTDFEKVSKKSIDDLEKELHQIIIKLYLQQPYNDSSYIHGISYEEFSEFFAILCSQNHNIANLFEETLDRCLKLESSQILQVQGFAGTGKSSFLSVFYWYLFDRRTSNNTTPIPIFINFSHYSSIGASYSNKNLISNLIRRDLKVFEEIRYLNPDQTFILILDDDKEVAGATEAIWDYLSPILNNLSYKVLISSRTYSSFSNSPDLDLSTASQFLVFRSVLVAEEILPELIHKLTNIFYPNYGNIDLSSEIIKQFKLSTVDLFSLALLVRRKKIPQSASTTNLSQLINNFCKEFLQLHKVDSNLLDSIAEKTFDRLIRDKDLSPKYENLYVTNQLINYHPLINEYLIAQHVVNSVFKIAAVKTSSRTIDIEANKLQYVYPYHINRLARELINANIHTQQRALDGIEKILSRSGIHHYAKAHACYLAGRVEHVQARQKAIIILENFRKSFQITKNTKKDKADLLLDRSLFISLAYLGRESAQTDYVEQLLSDSRNDEFNRGFHLEYYGDEDYIPSEPLLSQDYLRPFPKTFEQLYRRLKKSSNPIFAIEAQTICSLAQHRHAHGKLPSDQRQRLITLIDDLLSQQRVKNTSLRAYIRMVRGHLVREAFRLGDVFNDYYKIKSLKRAGWLKRGITDGESVADHMYGAYLIALLLLEDDLTDSGYNKETILKMLLIHDLAEAIVGDKLPSQRNEDAIIRENEANEEIGMLGTYDGFANTKQIIKLYEEYEAAMSINARIAHDIDKLENLAQLFIYKLENRGNETFQTDFSKFKQDLQNSIKTEYGVRIMKIILESFESKSSTKDR